MTGLIVGLSPLIAIVSGTAGEGGRFLWPPHTVWEALLYVLLFGLLGIMLTVFGFKVFDWVLTRVNVEAELVERQNIAVAIVVAAVVLGISIVIAAAVNG